MSQPAPAGSARYSSEAATAQTVYILFLVGLVFPLMPLIVLVTALTVSPVLGWIVLAYALTPIIGLITVYAAREGATGWVQSHYQMQSRTLWLGLLYGVVAGVTVWIYIGWLIALFTLVWWIMRCAKGLTAVCNGMPCDNPGHYLW